MDDVSLSCMCVRDAAMRAHIYPRQVAEGVCVCVCVCPGLSGIERGLLRALQGMKGDAQILLSVTLVEIQSDPMKLLQYYPLLHQLV